MKIGSMRLFPSSADQQSFCAGLYPGSDAMSENGYRDCLALESCQAGEQATAVVAGLIGLGIGAWLGHRFWRRR